MSNHITTGSASSHSTLSKAILLYTSGHEKYISSASVHDIADIGAVNEPKFQILAGTSVPREAIFKALQEMSAEYKSATDFIPEGVLSLSQNHLIWYLQPAKQRVFFKNRELGSKTAVVSLPGLIFSVNKQGFSVFAYKGKKRPSLKTKMFHSPFFNVYDTGFICQGSSKVPDNMTIASIEEWTNSFFNSAFTHTNGQLKKTLHPRGEYALWKELIEGIYPRFPQKFLVPIKLTLNDLILLRTKGM